MRGVSSLGGKVFADEDAFFLPNPMFDWLIVRLF
jgi:hypothetical protein